MFLEGIFAVVPIIVAKLFPRLNSFCSNQDHPRLPIEYTESRGQIAIFSAMIDQSTQTFISLWRGINPTFTKINIFAFINYKYKAGV